MPWTYSDFRDYLVNLEVKHPGFKIIRCEETNCVNNTDYERNYVPHISANNPRHPVLSLLDDINYFRQLVLIYERPPQGDPSEYPSDEVGRFRKLTLSCSRNENNITKFSETDVCVDSTDKLFFTYYDPIERKYPEFCFRVFMEMPRTKGDNFARYIEARNDAIEIRNRKNEIIDIMNRNRSFRRLPSDIRKTIVRYSI
jgi:hypothetical protein